MEKFTAFKALSHFLLFLSFGKWLKQLQKSILHMTLNNSESCLTGFLCSGLELMYDPLVNEHLDFSRLGTNLTVVRVLCFLNPIKWHHNFPLTLIPLLVSFLPRHYSLVIRIWRITSLGKISLWIVGSLIWI